MKKHSAIFLILIASLSFFSCGQKNTLKGTWNGSYIIRNGMEKPEKKGEIVLYMNLENKIEYKFGSNDFSKKITQNLSSLEKVGDFELPKSEEEIAKELHSELTICGSYNTYGNSINFFADTVILKDGTEMDFADYQMMNPSIGEDEYHEDFELTDDTLTLGGIKFKKP